MGRISLGIDISEDLLSAVAVDGIGRDARVVDCAFGFLGLSGVADLAEELSLLLEQLRGKKISACTTGVSLSCLSLRNLSLPFSDEKKIQQILPFELEEQLLLPVDEQIITTVLTGTDEGETGLLAAAMEKDRLGRYIETFRSCGLEPERICPSTYALTDRFCRTGGHGNDTFLLLHCDLCSVKAALVYHGETVFLRCLFYPDTVFTDALFFRNEQDGTIGITDPEAADNAVNGLCESVQRGIDYFCFQNGKDIQPDYFMLTGPMQLCEHFREKLEAGLALSGRQGDLVLDCNIPVSSSVGHWQPALYDNALALALLAGRGNATAVNFRTGEFAPPHQFFRSKRQIMIAGLTTVSLLLLIFSYLFIDYRRLQSDYEGLNAKMEQIFTESFPGVKPGQDSLLHMRSLLKSMDTSTASGTSIFTEEKRILVLLVDISDRISEDINLQVARLIIDQNSVRIKGTTNAFNNVNKMQDVLSSSERYAEVNIVSATKGKGKEGILFELKLQLGAGENS